MFKGVFWHWSYESSWGLRTLVRRDGNWIVSFFLLRIVVLFQIFEETSILNFGLHDFIVLNFIAGVIFSFKIVWNLKSEIYHRIKWNVHSFREQQVQSRNRQPLRVKVNFIMLLHVWSFLFHAHKDLEAFSTNIWNSKPSRLAYFIKVKFHMQRLVGSEMNESVSIRVCLLWKESLYFERFSVVIASSPSFLKSCFVFIHNILDFLSRTD